SNNFGAITSSITALRVIDFSEALGATDLVWTTSGNAPWFVETNVTHDGVSALQSGTITNNQSTILQTAVTGPGTLTFWWKVSAPPDARIVFTTGTSQGESLGGNVDWQQQTFYVGEGPQALKWIFRKDSTTTSVPYSAWLDQVSFVRGATAPIITLAPASQ